MILLLRAWLLWRYDRAAETRINIIGYLDIAVVRRCLLASVGGPLDNVVVVRAAPAIAAQAPDA